MWPKLATDGHKLVIAIEITSPFFIRFDHCAERNSILQLSKP